MNRLLGNRQASQWGTVNGWISIVFFSWYLYFPLHGWEEDNLQQEQDVDELVSFSEFWSLIWHGSAIVRSEFHQEWIPSRIFWILLEGKRGGNGRLIDTHTSFYYGEPSPKPKPIHCDVICRKVGAVLVQWRDDAVPGESLPANYSGSSCCCGSSSSPCLFIHLHAKERSDATKRSASSSSTSSVTCTAIRIQYNLSEWSVEHTPSATVRHRHNTT